MTSCKTKTDAVSRIVVAAIRESRHSPSLCKLCHVRLTVDILKHILRRFHGSVC